MNKVILSVKSISDPGVYTKEIIADRFFIGDLIDFGCENGENIVLKVIAVAYNAVKCHWICHCSHVDKPASDYTMSEYAGWVWVSEDEVEEI